MLQHCGQQLPAGDLMCSKAVWRLVRTCRMCIPTDHRCCAGLHSCSFEADENSHLQPREQRLMVARKCLDRSVQGQ